MSDNVSSTGAYTRTGRRRGSDNPKDVHKRDSCPSPSMMDCNTNKSNSPGSNSINNTISTSTTISSSGTGKLAQEIQDEFLICKICLDVYKNPKCLTCLHTFCEECIENHVSSETTYKKFSDYRDFTCPLCRKRTQLPIGGVRKLPDNFLVSSLSEMVCRRKNDKDLNYCEICKLIAKRNREASQRCLECNKLLCKNCVTMHRETKVTKLHSIIDIDIEKDVICKEHSDEVVRFYCEPCQICVCVLCTFNEHHDHEVTNFTEAVFKYKSDIQDLLTECQGKIGIYEKNIEQIVKIELVIRNAEQKVRDLAIDFISEIRQKERQMIEEIHNSYGKQTLDLLTHKAEWQTQLETLRSTCSLTEVVLHGKDIELLLLKKEVQEKLECLSRGAEQSLPNTLNKIITFIPGHLELGFLDDSDLNETEKPKSAYKLIMPTKTIELQTEEIKEKEIIKIDNGSQTINIVLCSNACGTEPILTEERGVNTRTRPICTLNATSVSNSPTIVLESPSFHRATTTQPRVIEQSSEIPASDHLDESSCSSSMMVDNNSEIQVNIVNSSQLIAAGGELTASEKLIRARHRRRFKERSQTTTVTDEISNNNTTTNASNDAAEVTLPTTITPPVNSLDTTTSSELVTTATATAQLTMATDSIAAAGPPVQRTVNKKQLTRKTNNRHSVEASGSCMGTLF